MGLRSRLFKSSSEYVRLQEKLVQLKSQVDALTAEKKVLPKSKSKRGLSGSLLWEPQPGTHPYGQVILDAELAFIDESLKARMQPPLWATGHISDYDAALLRGLIARQKPSRMVEVGVASGYSTAVILDAMSAYKSQDQNDLWLHSYDIMEQCYFDQSRRTGSAVDELVPGLSHHVRFHFGATALAVRDLPDDQMFDLAFIDASHDHPWPTFDTLAILPKLKKGSWIVLHDIMLPFFHAEFQCCGANLLFSLWPGEKIMQPPEIAWRNIGAIRYDGNKEATRSMLASLFQLPWETSGPSKDLLYVASQDGK